MQFTSMATHLPVQMQSVLHGEDENQSNMLPHQLIESFANRSPDNLAVTFEGETLTYRTLNSRANELARRLATEGLSNGDVCAVLLKPCLESAISVLAIHKLGATYLPLDPEAPAQRLLYMIADAKPLVVLKHTNDDLDAHFGKQKLICFDSLTFSDAPCYDQNIAANIGDEDTANIFYTSGTTGTPKGVLASYANYRYYTASAISRFSMGVHTIMPTVAKFTFSISLFELMTPLVAGGSVVILPRETVLAPKELLTVLKSCTMVHIGPSLWLRVLGTIESENIDARQFDHMHHVSSGGDMVPPEVLAKLVNTFRNAEVFVVYGCSEVSCMGTSYFVDRSKEITKTFVGQPFANSHVAIVNHSGTATADLGDKGEICISSGGVARSYIGKAADFNNKIVKIDGHCYYRTGDIGRINPAGQIEMLGREDFQVKVSGVRIELSEIDYHLRKAPGISQAISMFWPTDEGENRIYAYITDNLTPDELKQVRTYLEQNLLEQMLPKSFIYLEALPLNPNLKVDRKALPTPSPENIIRESIYGIAETPTQKRLVEIWQAILGLELIGIDDDFFYSGGSSLNGVDLMQRIERDLGVTLGLNTLMVNRTIRGLAVAIDNHQSNEFTSQIVPIRKTTDHKSIFIVHDGNGDLIPYFSLSQQLDTDHSIYGVMPKAKGNAEIFDYKIEDIAKNYAHEIMQVKPEGPYVVAGLCIGGYLAYCVAAELESLGHEVKSVILFDSHNIIAEPRHDYEKNLRNARLKELLDTARKQPSSVLTYANVANALVQKCLNFGAYKASTVFKASFSKLQILALKSAIRYPFLAQYKLPFPDVDRTLRAAEKHFTLKKSYSGKLVLFLAQKRLHTLDHLGIDDTPYKDHFHGDDLGWSKTHKGVTTIYPVQAGHSTLLTPPFTEIIAEHLLSEL